jgi:predicted DNA-binding ribbon-helix-helix protein
LTEAGERAGVVYRAPVKHSVTIAGHETAITLEPIFWTALRDAAVAQALPLNALIAQIDVERIAVADPPNLASAIRQWLMSAAQAAGVGVD